MHFDKNQLYTFIDKFDKKKISNFKNIKNVIFRNYKKKIDLKTIIKIKKECKNKQLKFYLSNDIKLALKANLDGVYIPSFNTSLNLNNFRNKKKNFKVLGSAHNLKEIKFKERQGVEIIFLSPLFLTKNY
jgi:thiamine-phosphate pyrophosphorylase